MGFLHSSNNSKGNATPVRRSAILIFSKQNMEVDYKKNPPLVLATKAEMQTLGI